MVRDSGNGQHGGPAHHLNGFSPSAYNKDAWWGQDDVPSARVPGRSNVFADGGARLLWSSIPRNPKMRQTFMAGPRECMLSERVGRVV